MTDLEIAQNLGQQVHDNFKKPGTLVCPICKQWSGPKDASQPMSSMGDERELLFCPHCDLMVELKVIFNSSEKQ